MASSLERGQDVGVRRDQPDVFEPVGTSSLPAPASTIVAALGPLVSAERHARIEAVIDGRLGSVIAVLEDLADPHNASAVLRSADAFGLTEVHVIEGDRRLAASRRVSKGTDRWVELRRHQSATSCIDHLHARGFEVFIAAADGEHTPETLAARPKVAVIFGNEHRGASEEARARADGAYRIPMRGFVESLNVSVATAITLHALTRGRAGDLDEEGRTALRARFLMASVFGAELIVREHLRRAGAEAR